MSWRSLHAVAAVAAVLAAGCAGPAPADPQAQEAAAAQPPTILLPPGEPARAPGEPDPTPADPGFPAGLHRLELLVGDEPAHGLVAVPDAPPRTLVVVAHGLGGDAASHERDLRRLMEAGVLAVAMDYRGERGAFKVRTGVEDTVAATAALQAAYPAIDQTLLYGWSMGGEVALLAPMAAPAGTYDHVFVGAGVMDLEVLWHENPALRRAIEEETGGTPADVPQAYAERSPVRRVAELPERGVDRVFLVHGAADGPVPVEQSERMYNALAEAGQPVLYYVVTKDRSEPCVPDGPCLRGVPVPAGHEAGQMRILQPFLDNRIQRLEDPVEPALRGTYDAATGDYDPKDTR